MHTTRVVHTSINTEKEAHVSDIVNQILAAVPKKNKQKNMYMCDQRKRSSACTDDSLIRVFTEHIRTQLGLGCPFSVKRKLWLGCMDAQMHLNR